MSRNVEIQRPTGRTVITPAKRPVMLAKAAAYNNSILLNPPLQKSIGAKRTLRHSNNHFNVVPLKKTISYQATLPNELILHTLSHLSIADLCATRSVNRRWNTLADVLLKARLVEAVKTQTEEAKAQRETLLALQAEKQPLLNHYGEFLLHMTGSELPESVWYTSPSAELQTVCECLCILKGCVPRRKSESVDNPLPPMTWLTIRKHMTRFDFKSWMINLRSMVDFVQIHNVKRVENIIMHDPTITYDRLREVSRVGYRYLIVVAAILQYCTIQDAVKVQLKATQSADKILYSNTQFLSSLCGGDATEQIIHQIAKAALV